VSGPIHPVRRPSAAAPPVAAVTRAVRRRSEDERDEDPPRRGRRPDPRPAPGESVVDADGHVDVRV